MAAFTAANAAAAAAAGAWLKTEREDVFSVGAGVRWTLAEFSGATAAARAMARTCQCV